MRRALVVVLVLGTAGCGGSGPATVRVSGAVTLDGVPVPEGRLIFEAADAAAAKEMAAIRGGRYEARLTPGSWRVRITSERVVPGQSGAMKMPLLEQIIPKRYNDASELTLTVTGNAVENFALVGR